MAGRLERAKLIAEILKIAAGPVLMIVFAIIFFGPIKDLVKVVPDRLKEANKVSAGAGGLSWEIQQKAKAQGNPQLAQRLQGLSENAVRNLLAWDDGGNNVGRGLLSYGNQADGTRVFYLPAEQRAVTFNELEAKKLLQCDIPLEQWRTTVDSVLERSQGSARGDRTMVVKPSVKEPFDTIRDKLNNFCRLTRSGRMAVDLVVDVVSREISSDSSKAGAAK